jgi:hypothetical protein
MPPLDIFSIIPRLMNSTFFSARATETFHLPATCLPTWEVASLPAPKPLSWMKWRSIIGPGIVMMGVQIGGGEWLFGPEMTARYGAALMWLATIAIITQVFYNMECGRYALYCGEPIFTGFLRTKPGPSFWIIVFLLLSIGGIIPGLAFHAASIVASLILNRPPTEADRMLVLYLAYGCLAVVILPVMFGGKIYTTIQSIMTAKVLFVLGFSFFMGVLLVTPENWFKVFSGFLKFGSIPSTAVNEQHVVNAFAYRMMNGRWPSIELEHIAVIAAFAGVAGGGGLGNSLYSNYVRDKGWGMGSLVGAIPSAIGGKDIQLSHLGKVFLPTEENLRRWKLWWRYIVRDQALIWGPGCFIGMALPSLLSMQFARNSKLFSQSGRFEWTTAIISADGIRQTLNYSATVAQVFWVLTLLVGLMVLLPSQLSVVEDVSRRWTDVIWSANARVRTRMEPHQVKYIYYTILISYTFWCLISLYWFGMYGTPKLMFLIVANLGNIAIGVTSFLVLWVNCRMLPKTLRPRWYHRTGILCCGVFYLGLALLVFVEKQLPIIKELVGW